MYDLKKLIAGIAAIAALGLGGSAIAGAQNSPEPTPPAAEQSAEQPGTAGAEGPGAETPDAAGEKGETDEKETPVAAADAKQASDAALAEVGSGKVTEVSAETPETAADKAEAPEKGEKADPAYEQQIAYDVEVTKADGSVADVALDRSFSVLGTEAGEQDEPGGEQNEAAETAETPPAK